MGPRQVDDVLTDNRSYRHGRSGAGCRPAGFDIPTSGSALRLTDRLGERTIVPLKQAIVHRRADGLAVTRDGRFSAIPGSTAMGAVG
jgi:hypothetical protein